MKHFFCLTLFLCVSIFASSQSLNKVKKDGKWGMTSRVGDTVIPFKYDSLKFFSYGLIGALKNDKWGFINKKNEVSIPFKFDAVEDFEYSSAIVTIGEKKGLINLKGEFIVSPTYKALSLDDGYIIYKKEGTAGLMDTLGQKISPVYQDIDFFNHGKISIKKNGKWGSWKDGVENMNDDYLLFSSFDLHAVFSENCIKDYQKEITMMLDKFQSYSMAEDRVKLIRTCSEEALLSYVYKNIVYPLMARDNGIEGLTSLNFVVLTDGSVSDVRITRDIGGGCAQAGLKVLEASPKWHQAAIKDHQKVNAVYKIPIRFRLTQTDDDEK